jgi:hypothetical protein
MTDEARFQGQSSASPATSTEQKPPRRVAIIGVHGVAHHDPGETANAMADLLLSLPSYDPRENINGHERSCAEVNPPRQFTPFTSMGIQLPLQPICIDEKKRVEARYKKPRLKFHKEPFFKFPQEGSAEFARAMSPDDPAEASSLTKPGGAGHQFTAKLLQDYRGGADGNKYITTRLEGRREKDKTEVHIYEMFWADLARPTNTLLSFFLALFQLILHLPSLSRLAIDTRPLPKRWWKIFQSLQHYTSRMLQIFIPLLKVVLLIVLLAAIPAVTTATNLRLLSGIIAGVIVATGGFILMNSLRRPIFKNWISWLLASFSAALLMAGIVFTYVYLNEWSEIDVLSVGCWVLGLALLWYALDAYDDVRRGVLAFGVSTYVAALVLFVRFAFAARAHVSQDAQIWMQVASLRTMQWILILLRVFWVGFTLLAICSSVCGAILWRSEPAGPEREKARAAVRTSRFAMALPAFLFVFVTAFIWAGLFSIAHAVRTPFFDQNRVLSSTRIQAPSWLYFDLLPVPSIASGFPPSCTHEATANCSETEKACGTCVTVVDRDYLKGVLAWSIGYGSYITVIVAAAGMFVLVWWALPSVLTEKFPLRRSYDPANPKERNKTKPPRDSNNRETEWMGSWSSRGLDSLPLVTFLIWSAIFVIPLVFLYLGPLPFHVHTGFRGYSEHVTKLMVGRAVAALGTVAVFTALVRYTSSVLRVVLDVDTYLRMDPREATPRAKIFERYVSLLRYVARYQDKDNRGYNEVVIVAHSLGSLISADLLRFLNNPETQTYDEDLSLYGFPPLASKDRSKIPITIKLFTMGNPLRQLLNRFFPYLYDWVRMSPDNRLAGTELTDETMIKKLHASEMASLPNPVELGVEKWVNAYRSGDYVGRSLWLNEWYRRTTTGDQNGIYPEPVYRVDVGNHAEFCIGAGAHTHYWDDTAPDIATTLNELI